MYRKGKSLMEFTPLGIKNRLAEKMWCVPIFRALVISALLHLLLFTVVTVVVEPAGKLNFYPTVSFLGSILNRESVSLVKETPHHFRINPALSSEVSSYSRKSGIKPARVKIAVFKIKRHSWDKKLPAKYLRRNAAQTPLNYFQRSLLVPVRVMRLGDVFTKKHNSPKLSAQANAIYFPKRSRKLTLIHLRAKKRTKSATNISWNSPYPRDILYKPPLPEYHLWMDEAEGDFKVEFEFLVSPQGRVIAVKKLTSSGLPGIDTQAMRYLKKWQFAPSPKEQWGRIRLNFELR